MDTLQMLALAQREQSNLARGFRSDALVESDLAHERDMAPADPKGCYCALGAVAVQLAKDDPPWTGLHQTGQRLTVLNGKPYGGFSYALDLLGTMQVNVYVGDLAPITLEAYIVRLNDKECLTFEQIADHLEKEIFPMLEVNPISKAQEAKHAQT